MQLTLRWKLLLWAQKRMVNKNEYICCSRFYFAQGKCESEMEIVLAQIMMMQIYPSTHSFRGMFRLRNVISEQLKFQ